MQKIISVGCQQKESKHFEVKSFYEMLHGKGVVDFPQKGIWKVKSPLRVAFFVWSTALGKILTIDNLRRRGIIVGEWHCMRQQGLESVDHLLLHCSMAKELWVLALCLLGVHFQTKSLFLSCGSFGVKGIARHMKALNNLLNYRLYQKLKLLGYGKFNHLTTQF